MNTQKQQFTGTKTHRFLVAGPLFALCFCISIALPIGSSESAPTASLFDLREGSGTLISGQVAAEGDAVLSQSGEIVLLRGSAIVASHTLLGVRTGEFTVQTWNGAVEVAAGDRGPTVAALTAPAIVRYKDYVWIVPAGMQMQPRATASTLNDDPAAWLASHLPLPLPPHYLGARLQTAERLIDMTLLPAVEDVSPFSPVLGQTFRFMEARERAEVDENAYQLARLYEALRAGKTNDIRMLFDDPVVQEALASAEGVKAMPTLLSAAIDADSMQLLLSQFHADADLTLLTRFHPAVRDHAGVLDASALNVEERMTLLIQLPGAIRDENALPEAAVRQWGDAWHAYLQEHGEEAEPLAKSALARLEKDIVGLDKAGLPERALLFARTVSDVFGLYLPSDPAVARLDDLAGGDRIVVDPVAIPVETVEESVAIQNVQREELHPQGAMELEESVRATVADMGAMFTSRTVIKAFASDRVQVSDVVFPTAAGDLLLSFAYNPENGMVVDIQKNGRVLPYSLTLQQYVEWVGK